MTLFTVAGIGILTALAVTAAREHDRSTGLALSLCGGGLLLFFCLSPIKEAANNLSSLISSANIDTGYIRILLKALGICLVGEFASDACKDFGLLGLSGRIELFAKTAVIICTMPILSSLVSAVPELVK